MARAAAHLRIESLTNPGHSQCAPRVSIFCKGLIAHIPASANRPVCMQPLAQMLLHPEVAAKLQCDCSLVLPVLQKRGLPLNVKLDVQVQFFFPD